MVGFDTCPGLGLGFEMFRLLGFRASSEGSGLGDTRESDVPCKTP